VNQSKSSSDKSWERVMKDLKLIYWIIINESKKIR
jgi:hypothetical protein